MLLNHTECCNRKIVAFLRYGISLVMAYRRLHADGGVRMMQCYVHKSKGQADAESDDLFGNKPNMSRVKRNGDTF